MDFSKVNNGRQDSVFDISKIEIKKNATYVGEFCLKTSGGEWANEAASIFYQKTPPQEGFSHYFALFQRNGTVYITSGQNAIEPIIMAVQADDGEIIYSRYRHDYRTSKDGSVFVDGGRDYFKSGGINVVPLKVVDGKFTLADLNLNNDAEKKTSSVLKIK